MKHNKGQAIIVLVMIIAIVSLMFTHVALLNISALKLSNEFYEGTLLRIKSEGYLEDTAMRFLRDTNYGNSGPIELNEGAFSCTIVVTDLGGFERDFKSTCTKDGRTKTVGMHVALASGVFTFSKIVEL
jgi:hypothetical protein